MGCHYYPLDPFGSHATSRGPQQAKNLEFQTEAPPHPSPIPWGNGTIRVATRRQATPNEASQPTKTPTFRCNKTEQSHFQQHAVSYNSKEGCETIKAGSQ